MMEYATRLTQNPRSMTSTDVATLRDNGFSDRAILEINLVAAYMNFVNRIASGMGVEFEGDINKFTR
jgi:alkylhydroperoxidase family enzyme